WPLGTGRAQIFVDFPCDQQGAADAGRQPRLEKHVEAFSDDSKAHEGEYRVANRTRLADPGTEPIRVIAVRCLQDPLLADARLPNTPVYVGIGSSDEVALHHLLPLLLLAFGRAPTFGQGKATARIGWGQHIADQASHAVDPLGDDNRSL